MPTATTEKPFTAAQAAAIQDENGFVAVVVRVDKNLYMAAHAARGALDGGDDELDLVHDIALDFGCPQDCSAEILASCGDYFVVEYTTHMASFLDEED